MALDALCSLAPDGPVMAGSSVAGAAGSGGGLLAGLVSLFEELQGFVQSRVES